MSTRRQLTNERLHKDVTRAIEALAGRMSRRAQHAEAANLMDFESEIRNALIDDLRRNWTFTERARGERRAG